MRLRTLSDNAAAGSWRGKERQMLAFFPSFGWKCQKKTQNLNQMHLFTPITARICDLAGWQATKTRSTRFRKFTTGCLFFFFRLVNWIQVKVLHRFQWGDLMFYYVWSSVRSAKATLGFMDQTTAGNLLVEVTLSELLFGSHLSLPMHVQKQLKKFPRRWLHLNLNLSWTNECASSQGMESFHVLHPFLMENAKMVFLLHYITLLGLVCLSFLISFEVYFYISPYCHIFTFKYILCALFLELFKLLATVRRKISPQNL